METGNGTLTIQKLKQHYNMITWVAPVGVRLMAMVKERLL